MVEVAYTVPPADQPAFFRAMDDLRTVRLRDGAFRWSLYRDLTRHDVFRELFVVESWGEHTRQHARFTVENWRIEQRALQFHAGPEPPAVSHCLRVDLGAEMPPAPAVATTAPA